MLEFSKDPRIFLNKVIKHKKNYMEGLNSKTKNIKRDWSSWYLNNELCEIVYCATRGKKIILRVNHTSKINVFPVSHTMFFLLGCQKMDLIAPHGAIKSTLWPAIIKSILYILLQYLNIPTYSNWKLNKMIVP